MLQPPRRVLVIGGDGLVGAAVVRHLVAQGIEVIATTRRPKASACVERLFLDLALPSAAWPPLPAVDAAVICAAQIGFANCRANPQGTARVNVNAAHEIVRRLADTGAATLYLSSIAVFDCAAPHIHRNVSTAPATEYGRQKAEAERRILAVSGDIAVLRLSKVLDPMSPLLQDWIANLTAGKRIAAFSDMAIAPLTNGFVAELIGTILARRGVGIFHASGDCDLSSYDLALILADAMGADRSRVVAATSPANAGPEAPLAFNSLDMSRERDELGIPQPSSLVAMSQTAEAASRLVRVH